jgi:hypothetical protein
VTTFDKAVGMEGCSVGGAYAVFGFGGGVGADIEISKSPFTSCRSGARLRRKV